MSHVNVVFSPVLSNSLRSSGASCGPAISTGRPPAARCRRSRRRAGRRSRRSSRKGQAPTRGAPRGGDHGAKLHTCGEGPAGRHLPPGAPILQLLARSIGCGQALRSLLPHQMSLRGFGRTAGSSRVAGQSSNYMPCIAMRLTAGLFLSANHLT